MRINSYSELFCSFAAGYFCCEIFSLAQEESRSISENVTWGQRKRMADGKVSLPYGQFLGYRKGEDGLPEIVESEAEIVRIIFRLFIEGKTPSAIAKFLETKGEIYAKDPTFQKKRAFMANIFCNENNERYKYKRFDYLYLEDTLTEEERLVEAIKTIKTFFVEE